MMWYLALGSLGSIVLSNDGGAAVGLRVSSTVCLLIEDVSRGVLEMEALVSTRVLEMGTLVSRGVSEIETLVLRGVTGCLFCVERGARSMTLLRCQG